MTTTTLTHCLECNAPLSPAEAQGLCARCLFKMGLASQLGETSVADAGARRFVAPPAFPFEFGNYRVLRLLGRGGMGAVYEAEQVDTGRRVALKVLGHTIDSPEMRKRFLREGRLAAAVNHPNSVYIFGTEEIDATPVIAMELVAGGTLKDEVKKRGPLPVRDAVDAILGVIAGLEAAQSGGVLHRDVKPANCFVAPDGTVKVGDFGLSVSTLASHDSQLTASGTMLGTPSFAPPEQLRGDELDVRADIYSVGATLYSMLTGKPPFDGENAVQVVAAVLDKMPKPLADFRSDVPPSLAQVIAKCLAKKRDDRFADYASLRDALVPFSSQAREPAPVGLRIVAGMIDVFLATSICWFLWTNGETLDDHFLSTRSLAATLQILASFFFGVAYFAIPEGLWGASIGKMLCGLRVAGAGRGAPGIPLATLRALIVMLGIYFADLLAFIFTTAEQTKQAIANDGWTFADMMGPSFLFVLFVTMRRRNGFAAIHDLLTGTRVVVRQTSSARPRIEVASDFSAEKASPENAPRVGPFRIVAPIGGAWRLGHDDVLRRNVWIRDCTRGTPPLDPARRDLGRAGRLRWIAGARGESENWDAFDAPNGKPLAELFAQPWSAVRFWLLDLAEELEAAMKDDTLPAEIGLDHVFITADGRALLLDESWPKAARTEHFPIAEVGDAQRFLSAVADASLDRTRLPLHARDFLKKLADAAFDRASFLAGNLRSLLAKPATITRRRRFASLALAPALALVIGITSALFVFFQTRRDDAKWADRPELRKLELAMTQYNNLQGGMTFSFGKPLKDAMDQQAVRDARYIAGHFGEFIDSPAFDSDPVFGKWPADQREAAREIVRQHPSVKPDELKSIDAIVEPSLQQQIEQAHATPYFVVPGFLALTLVLICISQLFSLLIFGATLGQRLFGFSVVNKRGEPAGRGRMLWRWCVAWVPLLLLIVRYNFLMMGKPVGTGVAIFFGLKLLLWFACFVAAAVTPEKGVHDEIAGTRLVPR